MVVLSSAVCTKSGKCLFSRQYVDMTRGRVEGLLAAFPKLISAAHSTQHTYIDTDAVRYVYQPLDKLYVVLITNKQSNIMEDLDTLRLLSKLVPDICGTVSSSNVISNVFDLLFAFDEAVTSGGYKEDITLRQVKINMEMNSHDERLAQLIRQSKINEAREVAANKAKALSSARKAAARAAGKGGFASSWAGGFGAGGAGASGGGVSSAYDDTPDYSPRRSTASPRKPASKPAATSKRPKRGMKLGKKEKKGASLLQNIMAEEHIPAGVGAGAGAGAAVEEAKAAGPSVDVDVVMEEKLMVQMTRDGALNKMQVAGTMTVTCNNESCTRLRVGLDRPEGSGFQFQPHPNVSKPAWKEGALTLKDLSRTFPVGAPAGVLRWRCVTKDDARVPIVFNVWPEEVDMGMMTVNVEYTLQEEGITLNDLIVEIPIPPGCAPDVSSCDGANSYDSSADVLRWSLASGTIEFNVACDDDSAFFPVNVHFSSHQCLCPIEPSEAVALDAEGAGVANATYHASKALTVNKYIIAADD